MLRFTRWPEPGRQGLEALVGT